MRAISWDGTWLDGLWRRGFLGISGACKGKIESEKVTRDMIEIIPKSSTGPRDEALAGEKVFEIQSVSGAQ